MERNEVQKEKFLKLNFFKKIWYSIYKFEKYPELAALGVKRAIIYFTELMAIFSALLTIIFVIYASNIAEFEEQNLSLNEKIVKVLLKESNTELLETEGTENIEEVLENSPESTIIFSMFIGNFISYYLITLIDVFTLSVFGLLTCFFAKIKMNYKAVFNMSVYALTLATILKIIYIGLQMLANFEIKNFNIMYIAVSYISLAAAIFLIKSDVIKQHLELMRIIEENKNKIERTITIPKKPKENEDDENENEEEKNNKDKNKDEKGSGNTNAGQQGSNA